MRVIGDIIDGIVDTFYKICAVVDFIIGLIFG